MRILALAFVATIGATVPNYTHIRNDIHKALCSTECTTNRATGQTVCTHNCY